MVCTIGISGPSSSGKTTVCKQIQKNTKSTLIKLDNYWKAKAEFPEKQGYKNWDSPQSIDFKLFHQNLIKLQQNKKVKSPVWKHGKQIGTETLTPSQFILAEGFLLFYKENIRKLFDLKFYVDIPEGEILKRRIQRSKSKKSRKYYYREIMLTEHRKYVVSQKKYADIILDGTTEIKEKAQKILKAIETTCFE